MNAIQSIDIVEKIKGHLLLHEPGLERRLETLAAARFEGQPDEFFEQKLIATLLRLDEETAEGKRRIRRMWSVARAIGATASDNGGAVAEGGHGAERGGRKARGAADGGLEVREEWRDLYVSFSEKQREQCEAALAAFAQAAEKHDGIKFAARLAACAHPMDAIKMARQTVPALSALMAAEFLAAAHYPIIVPANATQRLMQRLGLIEHAGQRARDVEMFFVACNELAHHANTPLAELNFLLRLFCGGAPGWNGALAVCVTTPRCKACPLTGYCAWFKFNGKRRESSGRVPIKMWNEQDRPREKMAARGADALTDAELLAIILRTGSGEDSALELAQKLMQKFKSLEKIEAAPVSEMTKVKGIGAAKAIEIKAALTLGRRLVSAPAGDQRTIGKSEEIYRLYGQKLENRDVEYVRLLLLNSKNMVMREVDVSKGSLSASIVHPRDTLKHAVHDGAAAVVLLHNHPSGDPSPSQDDFLVTGRLKDASEILGIKLLDHIIVGRKRYYSFADMGTL